MFQAAPSLLESITIASPCPADWEGMTGNERVRFCGECQLNVYNLSGMSRQEAEVLIREREGRLCVRYFQRADGTMMTRDCPVGLQALHKRKIKRLGQVAAAVTVMTVIGTFCVSQANPAESKSEVMSGSPAVSQNRAFQELKGDVAMPPMQGGVSVEPPPPVRKMGEMKMIIQQPKPANPDAKKSPSTKKPSKSPKLPNQGTAIPTQRQLLMGKIAPSGDSRPSTPVHKN
ncbi:MAG TPA: hypothetical protein V6C52_13005 [Coleofasciculaceae cyanobacterium]